MGAPVKYSSEKEEELKKAGTWWKRAFLAASTLGTSEIQTGGGEYGDEVLADSLFPKSINDFALDERSEKRRQAELAKSAIAKPPPTPDLADQLLQGKGSSALLRQKTKQGRRSTFLGGGQY